MKVSYIYCVLLITITNICYGQNIKFKPYLQDATPHSMVIMWQTDTNNESIVAWGETPEVLIQTQGTSENIQGTIELHTVKLEDLNPFTKYYYKVITGNATSAVFSFKTPPHSAAHEPFKIVAMSDMQQDSNQPNKFNEIIHEGIIDYLENEFGGDLIDNLALVMIPGDLVDNGNNFPSWSSTFFEPAQDLFSRVPVYPVPGNHEQNSMYFFQYFKLPNNGTEGFEEHWWHKDYGNVRIIGLDSNNPFSNQEQLDWLDELLDNTCISDSIDFVFAQLHHPHKSELWTPGESDYTGEVIQRLENFSTNCQKPSIHFFGHTHAYSRGHSKDHKHLWINVATAGGAIDNWGEFPNFDYDEFAISQDEYGFVVVEITDDNDPKFVIKRITRGDQNVIIDNQLVDSMTVHLNPYTIHQPIGLSPINDTIPPECVLLKANAFSAEMTTLLHGQTEWQISLNNNDFSSPVKDIWRNFENWYFEENTQALDDLTDEKIEGLNENTQYWWRVRYRDRTLNWSQWSDIYTFQTGSSFGSPNLILNPGSEDSLNYWIIEEGIVESLTEGICNGVSPHSGERYFIVGGLCESSETAICSQNIDISTYADSIDMSSYSAHFGGYLSDYSGSDIPEMKIFFLDENMLTISSSSTLSANTNSWQMVSQTLPIPSTTRHIKIELKGTRNAGEDNDAYFDDLFLTVGPSINTCDGITSTHNQPINITTSLKISPNPVKNIGKIQLPLGSYKDIKIYLTDVEGKKISIPYEVTENNITLHKLDTKSGVYFFWVKDYNKLIGQGKIIFK